MFEVNTPQIDYLTLTTYNPKATEEFYKWATTVNERQRERQKMQYTGFVTSDRYGTCFVGSGQQGTRDHALMQVSGSLAVSAWNSLKHFVNVGQARVTRIDLQITVEYDRQTHSQADLAAVLRDNSPHRAVSYIESKSGPQGVKLATVYYGSRISDRYTRIYEKQGMSDEILLRFEVEYKAKRATAVAMQLLQGASIKALLFGELTKIPYVDLLHNTFSKVLSTTPKFTRVVREPGNTEVWLRDKVANSLNRYLEQHETDSASMAEHFLKIIRPYLTDESVLL
jgi:DNA relaxase NicK